MELQVRVPQHSMLDEQCRPKPTQLVPPLQNPFWHKLRPQQSALPVQCCPSRAQPSADISQALFRQSEAPQHCALEVQ